MNKSLIPDSRLINGDLFFSGITSFIFTKYGQGYYLLASSEYQKVTLSARYQGDTKCTIELAEGMRPEAPQEPEAPAGEAAAVAEGGEQPASQR